jgi:Domain of unknown function (DUF4288)
MNTYLAKLVFNIAIENNDTTSQFDEQIRLIQAKTAEDAFLKARTVGRKEEETFLNAKNELVNWKFIDVADLYPLQGAEDNAQIYSLTHETNDSNGFIQFIRQKAMMIQTNFSTFV